MQSNRKLFGERLVERNIITQKQLDEALHRQRTSMGHRRIGEILRRLGYISESHIAEALSDQFGMPVKISDREIPDRVRILVDAIVATYYRVIPVEDKGDTIVLATSDPANGDNLDNLSRLLDKNVETVLATPEEIEIALHKYYGL
jgi:hypothetical protein